MRAALWIGEALQRVPNERTLRIGSNVLACSIWEPENVSAPTRNLLLLHGNAANRHWWDSIAPHLANRFRVVSFDLSGHGDSSHTNEYSLDFWVDEVFAVVETYFPFGPLALVGHSLGGLIALKSAWREPSAVRQVVLLDTPLRRYNDEQLSKRREIGTRPLKRHPDVEAAVAAFRTVPPSYGTPPEVLRHVAELSVLERDGSWQLKLDPRIYLRRTNREDFLRPWPAGTTLFRAGHGLIDDHMAREVEGLLPRGGMLEMQGLGHNMLLEDPHATYCALMSVLI
jgi:pimeloyl-ACP methyl ester carboxylesterase